MNLPASMSSRNKRKHFVKCVDCACQTLPQNASKERWGAAASLCVSGRVNDGALCFSCANKRRALLGSSLEHDDGLVSNSKCQPPVLAPANETTLRNVCVNGREYAWSVTTLESLLAEWKGQLFYEECKRVDSRWWRVVVNGRIIVAADFSSVPISEGDEISIVMGRGRTVRSASHE